MPRLRSRGAEEPRSRGAEERAAQQRGFAEREANALAVSPGLAPVSARCIDWRRQRPVLEALRRGEVATWLPFDWGAFDGRLGPPVRRESCPIVLLEGVYSARPELWDLLDLRVHLAVSEPVRLQRLLAREGELGPWELQWHEAEDHYFSTVMPADRFDLALAWESESL